MSKKKKSKSSTKIKKDTVSTAHTIIDTIKAGASLLTDSLFSGVVSKISEEAEVLMEKVETKALVIEEKLIRKISASIIVGVAFLMLIFAFFFYLLEYQMMNRTFAFLITGVIVLLIGFYFKYKYLKEEKEGE